ncbi:hypothetical protein DICVIV_13837 [Dictyocaulus viviparus]|uniref:Uncharacterized protein n=1 Tax=Dictyocaulus viviparus TaxID=29172 RepID=A0A0D8X9D1_DICVI|nr:hypothetical protein DICVIV_13837 [Dictyocaulus viviparus]
MRSPAYTAPIGERWQCKSVTLLLSGFMSFAYHYDVYSPIALMCSDFIDLFGARSSHYTAISAVQGLRPSLRRQLTNSVVSQLDIKMSVSRLTQNTSPREDGFGCRTTFASLICYPHAPHLSDSEISVSNTKFNTSTEKILYSPPGFPKNICSPEDAAVRKPLNHLAMHHHSLHYIVSGILRQSFLQQIYPADGSSDRELIVKELFERNDLFEEQIWVTSHLLGRKLYPMCLNRYSCRVIQKVIEVR